MYTVSKTFSFCYGHRLFGDKGKCGHLHGHSARATFVLSNENLDSMGMVYHFDRLKETVGKWILENFDHSMLLSENDPIVKILEKEGEKIYKLPFSPTAENIAHMLFLTAEEFKLPATKVEVWESDTAKATFEKTKS